MIWPFTTIATLRRELQNATAHINAMGIEINTFTQRQDRRLAEIDRLSKELAKARKNDTAKDAKTGKFTKKAKDV
jgi:uncharacterized protein YdaU (DUF1376 family)